MVSIVQVQANCSLLWGIVFALFLAVYRLAPAALQIHTVFRFPDLGRILRADSSSQTFIYRCWHAVSSVPQLDMICPAALMQA